MSDPRILGPNHSDCENPGSKDPRDYDWKIFQWKDFEFHDLRSRNLRYRILRHKNSSVFNYSPSIFRRIIQNLEALESNSAFV